MSRGVEPQARPSTGGHPGLVTPVLAKGHRAQAPRPVSFELNQSYQG
jgi:hypothetical protein